LTGRRHTEHRGIPRRAPQAEHTDCVRELVGSPHCVHKKDTPSRLWSRLKDGSEGGLRKGSTALSSSMRLCSSFQRKRTSAYTRTCVINCSDDTNEYSSGTLSSSCCSSRCESLTSIVLCMVTCFALATCEKVGRATCGASGESDPGIRGAPTSGNKRSAGVCR